MQLGAQVAPILVDKMLSADWESLRNGLTSIFRRGGEETVSRHAEILDGDKTRLTEATEKEIPDLTEETQGRWAVLLAAFLQQYPEAADELKNLIEKDSDDSIAGNSGPVLIAKNNKQSQVVQAGGNIAPGGSGITYGRPEEDQKK